MCNAQSLSKMGVGDGYVDADDSAAISVDGLAQEEDKFDALNTWLLENGAEFPHLYMKRYSEGYRGVHIRVTVPVSGRDMMMGMH